MSAVRFDDAFIDQVKSAVLPSEYIGRTVTLTRSGAEFRGLSPFSKEKTPSFFVNDAKGMFFDFSSGKNGDLLAYIMELDRVPFTVAMERLASHAGIPMPSYTPQEAAERAKRQRLYELCHSAANWFIAQLFGPVAGAREALQYLRSRGLQDEKIRDWKIGFAPAAGGLRDYLKKSGFTDDEGLAAGLFSSVDGGLSERFRSRIMFPIEETRARRVASFGGRALADGAMAKYLNGPETEIFSKSQILFGLATATSLMANPEHIFQNLVVVEGYFDVVSSQLAGIPAVATMGTAMSEAHLKLLWQRCDEPTIFLDGDKAGITARGKVIDRALPALRAGKSIGFASSDGGKDPDEILRTFGADRLIQDALTIQPLWQAVYERARGTEELNTPERLVAFRQKLLAAADKVGDPDIGAMYRSMMLSRYSEDHPAENPPPQASASCDEPVEQEDRHEPAPAVSSPTAPGSSFDTISPIAASLLHAGVENPDWISQEIDQIISSGFGDPGLRTVADMITKAIGLGSQGAVDKKWLRELLVENGFAEELEKAAAVKDRSGAPYLLPRLSEPLARLVWRHTLTAHNRYHALKHMFDHDNGSLIDALGQATFLEFRGELDRLRSSFRSGYFWEQLVAGLQQIAENE